ncbi:MAG: hypothetical protein WD601_07395, partial [Pseudohongiellaceae bacterium]
TFAMTTGIICWSGIKPDTSGSRLAAEVGFRVEPPGRPFRGRREPFPGAWTATSMLRTSPERSTRQLNTVQVAE